MQARRAHRGRHNCRESKHDRLPQHTAKRAPAASPPRLRRFHASSGFQCKFGVSAPVRMKCILLYVLLVYRAIHTVIPSDAGCTMTAREPPSSLHVRSISDSYQPYVLVRLHYYDVLSPKSGSCWKHQLIYWCSSSVFVLREGGRKRGEGG